MNQKEEIKEGVLASQWEQHQLPAVHLFSFSPEMGVGEKGRFWQLLQPC